MPAQTSRRSHRNVSDQIREKETVIVDLPWLGRTRLPRPDQVVYYGGLAALAALQIVEWPVAVVLGVGHALSEDHHNRVVHALGEALDEA
ncbi:hypothetical protein Mycch_0103 [Mycolicibacterium chubuense NBB4]|uniref:Uncharacterized protein n=1 Tax=Mycolicibacterium chubuense (strain NBB4) TaxID=710421 RepID=I4BCC3_MYCCN|nr:hypothetical protein [Mycolicibacterium chubuense]AFM14930.1 hypothetical protein Mycch_0103 [Mycolicibacterium chubuense NBB4]